ncbi:MAG TPA: RNA-binding S4 domain-containing protein [Clostridiales bacterium]|nr:RNA-binding S4 domain-containing protein [Clostridiales bacterium]
MRLDKYLKVSRVIKRRTVAKEICEAGRIQVNGHRAKAGHEIKIGDILDIAMGNLRLKIRVAEIKETIRANEASSLYEVLEENRIKTEKEELF